MSFRDALLKCLSGSDEVSFGRTMSAIAFFACILWDTSFVIYTLATHAPLQDILPPTERLLGQVQFCAACYGITKVTEIASAFAKK